MLSIGEFAQTTGLTTRALRHYHDVGLLTPADVDTGAYSDAQIRDAVLIKALRAAEMPIESVRSALAGPDSARSELDGFRTGLAATRVGQGAALDAADRLVGVMQDPAPVEERDAPAQHWVGLVTRVPVDAPDEETELAEDRANAACGALFTRLAEQGNPPNGAFWTALDADEADARTVELTLCWPLEHPAHDDLSVDGWEIRSGTLPERRELVARWEHEEDDLTPRGLPHPAFVALLSELMVREETGRDTGTGIAGVRQIVLGADGGPPGIELAITLG